MYFKIITIIIVGSVKLLDRLSVLGDICMQLLAIGLSVKI